MISDSEGGMVAVGDKVPQAIAWWLFEYVGLLGSFEGRFTMMIFSVWLRRTPNDKSYEGDLA